MSILLNKCTPFTDGRDKSVMLDLKVLKGQQNEVILREG